MLAGLGRWRLYSFGVMMAFDPATLLTVSATALVMSAFALLLMGNAAGADRRWWIAAFLLGAIGFAVMIAAPADALALPRTLANVAFLLAYGCCHAGARSLAGRRPVPAVLVGGALLWLILTWGMHVSVALRMPLASALVCVYALAIAAALGSSAREEERARRFAAWLCLLHAGFFAARIVLGPTFGLTAHHPGTAMSIWAAIVAFETIIFSAGLSILIVAALRDKEALADRRRALTDALTGIGNRHAFEMQARPLVDHAGADEPRPMLLLMDIDGFKAVNDRRGHAAGDRLLAAVAASARGCLIDGELFWRIGGDEFVALLRGPAVMRAPAIVEAIRSAVKQMPLPYRDDPAVAVTIGLASARIGQSLTEVLAEADAALYAGKRRGRDCAVIAGMSPAGIVAVAGEEATADRRAVANG